MLISFSPAYSDADFAKKVGLPKTTPFLDWIEAVVEPAFRKALLTSGHLISERFKIEPMHPLNPDHFKRLFNQIGSIPLCIPAPPPSSPAHLEQPSAPATPPAAAPSIKKPDRTVWTWLLSFWESICHFFCTLFLQGRAR